MKKSKLIPTQFVNNLSSKDQLSITGGDGPLGPIRTGTGTTYGGTIVSIRDTEGGYIRTTTDAITGEIISVEFIPTP